MLPTCLCPPATVPTPPLKSTRESVTMYAKSICVTPADAGRS